MSEENKNIELKEEELGNVSGGNGGSGGDWTITIKCNVGMTFLLIKEDKFSLQVSSDTTVSEVKQMINNKEGVDIAAQRLVFMGKELNDSKTLGSSGVTNGSEVYLIIRLDY